MTAPLKTAQTSKAAPARLDVILARASPLAVVFRRGPSDWCQLVLWHTDTDLFEDGQWFRGRMYSQRSDISPDGSLLLYFAANYDEREVNADKVGYDMPAWTAISTPPYVTALAMWLKRDTWNGGGLFEGRHAVWLNHALEDSAHHPAHGPQVRVRTNLDETYDPCVQPWTLRMVRDGWLFRQRRMQVESATNRQTYWPSILEKSSPCGQWKLVATVPVSSSEQWSMELFHGDGAGPVQSLSGTWCDFDQSGRIVIASQGKLQRFDPQHPKLALKTIADFNDRIPDRKKAPPWAHAWPWRDHKVFAPAAKARFSPDDMECPYLDR